MNGAGLDLLISFSAGCTIELFVIFCIFSLHDNHLVTKLWILSAHFLDDVRGFKFYICFVYIMLLSQILLLQLMHIWTSAYYINITSGKYHVIRLILPPW